MLKTPGLGRRKQTKLPGKRHSTFPVGTSQNSLNTKENDPAHSPSLSTSGNTLSNIEADVPPEIIDLLDDENNSMDVNSSDSFSDDVKQPKSALESKDVHSDEPKVPTNLKQALSDDDDSNSKQTTKKRKISVTNNMSITHFFKKVEKKTEDAPANLPSTSADQNPPKQTLNASNHSPSTSGKSTLKKRSPDLKTVLPLPKPGTKTYNNLEKNWRFYVETEEIKSKEPSREFKDIFETLYKKYKFKHQRSAHKKYLANKARIEASGESISLDHPFDRRLIRILTIPQEKAFKAERPKRTKFTRIASTETSDNDSFENLQIQVPSDDVVRRPVDLCKVYWNIYQQVLQKHLIDGLTTEEASELVAKSSNNRFTASTVLTIFRTTAQQITKAEKKYSVYQQMDSEIYEIISPNTYASQNEFVVNRKHSFKTEMEKAVMENIPDGEQLSFVAEKCGTSIRKVRMWYVQERVQECKNRKIGSSHMLTEIKHQAITSLDNLATNELCVLTDIESTLLSHFEPGLEPYTIKCSLLHNNNTASTIGFLFESDSALLDQVKEHMTWCHFDYYQQLKEGNVKTNVAVREDVHRIFSTVTNALTSPLMLSNLLTLRHSRVSYATLRAEKSNHDLSFEFFPESASGISAKEKWIFSFYVADKKTDRFKCRLFHAKSVTLSDEVYFEDGTLIADHLMYHLNHVHGISKDYGETNNSYKDSTTGQEICLRSVPSKTVDLLNRKLDVHKFPFQVQTQNTICASGFIEKNSPLVDLMDTTDYSSFATTLCEEDFKTLCFFKPLSGGKVICRLSHTGNNVIDCTREGSDESYALRKLREHLISSHYMNKTKANNKTVAIIGGAKISLTKMPFDIFQFYYDIVHNDGPAASVSSENHSISTLAINLSDVAVPLPESSSPRTEMYLIKQLPSCFFKIANSDEELLRVLNIGRNVRLMIAESNSRSTLTTSRNYIAFLKMAANSVYDFIDAVVYTGFTENYEDNRIMSYVKDLQQLVDGHLSLEQLKQDKLKNPKMYSILFENWKAGSECFLEYISESRMMSRKEGLFMERALIAVLKFLSTNCNRNHGMTQNHREIVQTLGVTEDVITQIGVAELVRHFKRNQFDIDLATPVKLYSDQITRYPANTPKSFLSTSALETMQIPPYSLTRTTVSEELHQIYAEHFFIAYFNIRMKDTNWFLNRPNSLELINQLEESSYIEQVESINSVLQYHSFDFNDCIQWGKQVWYTHFIANVEAAKVELTERGVRRFPASKMTERFNLDFIKFAALLLANAIGLKNVDIKLFESQIITFLNEKESYNVKEIPTFANLSLFTQLANAKVPHLKNYMNNSNQLANFSVHPIDPFEENTLFMSFLSSVISLRHYNFTGKIKYFCFAKIKPSFKIHSFLFSSRFDQII